MLVQYTECHDDYVTYNLAAKDTIQSWSKSTISKTPMFRLKVSFPYLCRILLLVAGTGSINNQQRLRLSA